MLPGIFIIISSGVFFIFIVILTFCFSGLHSKHETNNVPHLYAETEIMSSEPIIINFIHSKTKNLSVKLRSQYSLT